ncbi:hypothetical protein [Thauera humireducens]|uniref:hypothetical protein n=1 Tax=Thauera humireducens TaxID=1134435 RepID=UPI003C72411B
MAHEVIAHLHSKLVGNKDLEVEVKHDGAKLGTLLISKGNIEWLPANNHVNKHRMTWKQFAQIMEREGAPARVK